MLFYIINNLPSIINNIRLANITIRLTEIRLAMMFLFIGLLYKVIWSGSFPVSMSNSSEYSVSYCDSLTPKSILLYLHLFRFSLLHSLHQALNPSHALCCLLNSVMSFLFLQCVQRFLLFEPSFSI